MSWLNAAGMPRLIVIDTFGRVDVLIFRSQPRSTRQQNVSGSFPGTDSTGRSEVDQNLAKYAVYPIYKHIHDKRVSITSCVVAWLGLVENGTAKSILISRLPPASPPKFQHYDNLVTHKSLSHIYYYYTQLCCRLRRARWSAGLACAAVPVTNNCRLETSQMRQG